LYSQKMVITWVDKKGVGNGGKVLFVRGLCKQQREWPFAKNNCGALDKTTKKGGAGGE